MTKIIEFYGAPGSGKTSTAAMLFGTLKSEGRDVGLVTEFATDLAYDEYEIKKYDQIWIFANQLKKESRLYDKHDIIITDSALPLGCFYEHYYFGTKHTEPLLKSFLESTIANVIRKRVWIEYECPKYCTKVTGRYHNVDDCEDINLALNFWLDDMGIETITLNELNKLGDLV